MAIELPNGKISRTLPEQVGFNTKKIEEIIKAINDFELVDKVIDLDSASGVLTDTQFGIAELSPSFILYSGKVFVKAYEDGTNIDFIEVGALAGGTTTLTLSVERFRITVSTKAYQYAVVQLFESYTKAQIDTLLNAKANLSGANFTGPITSPSIIENMSGFSMSLYSVDPTKGTVSPVYGGIVKNGNKLTFVASYIFNKAVGASGSTYTVEIIVPESIGNKIYPYSGTTVAASYITAFKTLYATKEILGYMVKSTATRLYISINFDALDEGEDYYIRHEITLLLSDNLLV